MITCKLYGGLGNQMFQIAATYAHAKRNNYHYAFDFKSCSTPNQGNTSHKYRDNFFRNINELISSNEKFELYKEHSFKYNDIPVRDNLMLDGYFQSEKYFSDYKNDLFLLFHFPLDIVIKTWKFIINKFKIKNNIITSIHIRRGDYLEKSYFHTNLSETDYYKRAIEIIGGDFIIVSDDIKWCKENIKGKNIHYSPFEDELSDLCLMTFCDNQIIANSSFSWWGAYMKLNMNENSKVIAPKEWFGSLVNYDTKDLIPNNWIKI